MWSARRMSSTTGLNGSSVEGRSGSCLRDAGQAELSAADRAAAARCQPTVDGPHCLITPHLAGTTTQAGWHAADLLAASSRLRTRL
jgi:phosphoglycerate dehydrogenase-like enzyme